MLLLTSAIADVVRDNAVSGGLVGDVFLLVILLYTRSKTMG